MNPMALIEIFIGAIFTALFNIAINVVQNKYQVWKNRTSALIVMYQGTAAIALILIALVTDPHVIKSNLSDFLWPLFITGTINIAFHYLFARSHAIEEVSLVAPILASTPTILILTSMVILHEVPTLLGWIGIWLLALGAYSLNLYKLREQLQHEGGYREWKVWLAPISALRKSKGVRLAFAAAMLGAVSINFDGLVSRNSNIMFGLGCVLLIVSAGHLVIALYKKQFQGIRLSNGIWKGPLILAICISGSNVITNFAYRSSLISYVGSLKRISIPITIIFAYFFLKERTNFKDRLLGGVLIMIGVICISLA